MKPKGAETVTDSELAETLEGLYTEARDLELRLLKVSRQLKDNNTATRIDRLIEKLS